MTQSTETVVPKKKASGGLLMRIVNVPGLLFLLLAAGVWELTVRMGWLDFQFLPAPSDILVGWGSLISSGELFTALGHTAMVATIGWFIACVIGLVCGIALGLSHTIWEWTAATLEVFRALPSITFLPLAVLLLGFSYQMELALVIYACIWPVLVNTMDGIHTVHPGLRDVEKTFKLNFFASVRKVLLPAAASKIIVGVRLSLTLALILAVAAEIVGNPQGLGYGMVMAQQSLQPGRMFAYFITIGLFGIVANSLLMLIIRFLMPGIVAASDRKASA